MKELELNKAIKVQIETALFNKIMLEIESHYDYETSEKLSKKEGKEIIVVKNKKDLAKRVTQIIKEFSEEKQIDINLVKDYIFNMLEKETEKAIEKNDSNDWEYIEAIGIISLNEDELEK